jgi:oxygen-independent coproporphyrinogen-3 oxidase
LYCEYCVLSNEEAQLRSEYVELLLKEIEIYKRSIERTKVVGFDLGGGTPSILPTKDLQRIMNAMLSHFTLADGFGVSIETTPKLACDADKIKAIRRLGIERISMGIQTVDPKVLAHVGRIDNTIGIIKKATESVRAAGFERFNIDLMYGFADQTLESFISTIEFALSLNPEYVTLYRNRYKGTKLEADAARVTLAEVNEQYNAAYDILTERGYAANLGKNTFSRLAWDYGTSEYLTKRVIEGTPYLGVGLGAQNMARQSLYYNQGAASKRIGKYQEMVESGKFPVQDLYLLPPDELMTKVVCVAFYFGFIDKRAFQKKFGVLLEEVFPNEVDFLIKNDLMVHEGSLFCLTAKGKETINGIIPLFYSNRSKDNLVLR